MKKTLTLILCSGLLSFTSFNQTWQPLYQGSSGAVNAIGIHNSEMYASGSYLTSPNVHTFAKWGGEFFEIVGDWYGLAGLGFAFDIVSDGDDMYVGGTFTSINGNADMNRIARYNSTTNTWSSLGTGLNGTVTAICVIGDVVYAGGVFTNAGGDDNADYIAKFENGAWSALSTTPLSTSSFSSVNALIEYNGNLVIGCNMEDLAGMAGVDYIMGYDGENYVSMGSLGSVGAVYKFSKDADGGLWCAGEFPTTRLKKYFEPTQTWVNAGATLNSEIWDMAWFNDELYVVGNFTNVGGNDDADYIVKLNSTSDGWEFVASGMTGTLREIEVFENQLIVGGSFTDAGGIGECDNIAILGTGTSSISEIENNVFNVYPNPSTGSFKISGIENSTDVTVYSSSMQVVFNQVINDNQLIDLSQLASGIYFVKIDNITKRIVKN